MPASEHAFALQGGNHALFCLSEYVCLAKQMPSRTQSQVLRQMARNPPKLKGGFELRVEPSDERHAQLTIWHDDVSVRLRAAVLGVPYPSGLTRLLAAEPDIEAVLVERIPRGLEAAAQRCGVGYLDPHGGGFLGGPGLVYFAAPRPDLVGIVTPSRVSPFAPKASRVVRALLSDPGREWRVSHLSTSVSLNPGNVHRTLGSLQEIGLIEQDRELYVVPDPGSLLEAWADANQPARQYVSLTSEGPLDEAVSNVIAQLDGHATVSGELAAELLAPHLPAQSAIVHCIDIEAWGRFEPPNESSPLPWNPPAVSGRIVVVLSDEHVGQFGSSINGVDFVSPQQLYVDLARASGRGRQAADEVRRQQLRY